ncbi:LytR/AlgR family response regulator transcription factor [Chitinophaga polysaccharea]|uniref:LytR/AlgR family response regulator transcription factor n=1 Tax=Chitinophaga polysaccharea TaxID=1293035 RepID=UPI001156D74D|nr:LytTR family transcriptional regulator DNA-binding domain-containing protein [Chitinophaga polysaccharea]
MENRVYTNGDTPAYNDVFKRVILSLLGAHFIVVYGDTEDIGKIIRQFDYYNALIVSFVIAFLLLYYIWMITRYLDQKLDWFQETNKRIAAQVLLGVVPAAAIAVLLAWVYFSMYGHKITETPYFDSDFPVIVLFIFLANIYYFLYYLVATFWPRDELPSVQKTTPEQQTTPNTTSLEQEKYRKVILVQTPLKSIPVSVEDIGYFFRENKQNYLRKKDGEIYEIQLSLDELEATLDPYDFFRINRQMIICFSSCKEIRPTTGPRLDLQLLPVYNDQVLVSETKVAAFKGWIER